MNGQHIRAKVRFRPESSGLPVSKAIISGRRRRRRTRCENPHQDVGAFTQISGACDNNGGANFGFDGALEDTDHDISRPQSTSSASPSSSRRTEAARNSLKSSSDQESDQSILRSGANAANRSINRDSSVAASGDSLRNAVSKDASCEFRETSMILAIVYGAPNAIGNRANPNSPGRAVAPVRAFGRCTKREPFLPALKWGFGDHIMGAGGSILAGGSRRNGVANRNLDGPRAASTPAL